MADGTPHRRDVFLNDRTKTLLWVEWERRRWHVDYAPAVGTCLQAMSLHLLSRPFTTDEEREQSQILQDIATLNALLRHDPEVTQFETHRWIIRTLPRLCRPALRTLFPPLAKFVHAWAIRLPLDAAIPSLPPWVAALVFPRSYDIRLTYRRVFEDLTLWPQEDVELVVEFRIRPGASRDELLEQFDLILARQAHLQQPRERRIHGSQDYYQRVFQAYALHHQGQTAAAIAQHLWPEDWQRQTPTHRTLVQRVRGYLKRAQVLIFGEQK